MSLSGKSLWWLYVPLALLVGASTAFAVFRPVQVVPRIAAAPEYTLIDQHGAPFSDQDARGKITLYGFGYTADPTHVLDQTLADMRAFETAMQSEGLSSEIALALILFDDVLDTPERSRTFAEEHKLESWVLLGGDADALKQMIGAGFGIYYEAIAPADLPAEDVIRPLDGLAAAYLQAERMVLVDDLNVIRAEYRAPLDLERALRDVRLIIREKNSQGAARTLNEAAHLFQCYPSN